MYVLHYVVYVYNNKVCSINYKKTDLCSMREYLIVCWCVVKYYSM